LRGVLADEAAIAFGDSMSPPSSSTSIVLTSERIAVVSADTSDLVRFLFFFASVVWVAAKKADIFPTVCRVRRGAATLYGAVRDVAGASSALPTVELETYCLHVRHVADLVTVLALVAQWCRAPVDALAVLKTQDATLQSDSTPKT
jgi:hypothetical protein